MEPDDSLSSSQQPTPCPYFEPDQSSSSPRPPPLSYSIKIHFNIKLPSTYRYSKWTPSLNVPHPNPVCPSPLPHTCYNPCPSLLLDLIASIIFGAEYETWSSSLCSFLQSPVTCPSLAWVPSLAPYCQTSPLHVLASVRDKKFHSHINQQAKL